MKNAPQETSILDDFYYFENKQMSSSQARKPVNKQTGYAEKAGPNYTGAPTGFYGKKVERDVNYDFFE